MKPQMMIAGLTVCASGAAFAGGVERSAQSVAILFEEGRHVELSFGHFAPSVSGTRAGTASGDMASSYTTVSLGYKMDIGDRMNLALILDQPIGANVAYPAGTGYLLQGTTAELTSSAITALLRYKFDNNVSVYGGLRHETVKGVVSLPFIDYTLTTNNDTELGYVVGVAWEKPEIAARVALTYNSAITHSLDSVEGGDATEGFDTEVPQSVNLDFQTGVAKDTLLFGSVRWQEWSAFDIDPPNYPFASPLVSYASDRVTYTVGIGRRFNDQWSAAVTASYEDPDGQVTGNLGPTDGFASVGLAATYTMDKLKITGGLRYVDIGDAITTVAGDFQDNSGVGVGLRIAYSF